MRYSQANSVYNPLQRQMIENSHFWEAVYQVNMCQGVTTESHHLTGGLPHLLFEIYRFCGGVLELGMREDAGMK